MKAIAIIIRTGLVVLAVAAYATNLGVASMVVPIVALAVALLIKHQ